MEIEELKTIWQKYDSNLDNLEKLNKKLIIETLLKKPQKRLNWMKYKTVYTLIASPIIVIVALHPLIKIENVNFTFILGSVITILVVIYLFYFNYRSYITLKGIDLGNDSIVESSRKVNNYKGIINTRQKQVWISTILMFIGVWLIIWKGLHFNLNTILFMVGLFIFTIILCIIQFKNQSQKIEHLEKEIHELNEYAK